MGSLLAHQALYAFICFMLRTIQLSSASILGSSAAFSLGHGGAWPVATVSPADCKHRTDILFRALHALSGSYGHIVSSAIQNTQQ